MSPHERQHIGDDDILWRRLTTPYWIKDSNGTRRVSSAAFKGNPHDLELSTHAAKLTTLEWIFNSNPYALGVGEIVARMARELELVVEHDPVDEDASHTVIHLNTQRGVRERQAKELANRALLKERPPLA